MLNPHLAEGTIARYCGREIGKATGGLQHLLTPSKVSVRCSGDAEDQCYSTTVKVPVLHEGRGMATPTAVLAKPTVEELGEKMLPCWQS